MPFTIEQFLGVFEAYNSAVYPMQFIFVLMALIIIFLAIKPLRKSNKIISALLAFFWLWMGVGYHLLFFSLINQMAFLFGAFFIFQSAILFYSGVIEQKLSFHFRFDTLGAVGFLLIIYALVIYPLLGFVFGHIYPQLPTFGVPCPTTIFTFGILLWTDKKFPIFILVIPILWAFVGFSAAVFLNIYEDFGLLGAGVISTIFLLRRRWQLSVAS